MSRVVNHISAERLRELLTYDPETGRIHRKRRPESDFPNFLQFRAWNAKNAGNEIFLAVGQNGYLKGTVMDKTMMAHRVAWALHYGGWPPEEIDHINGDRCDNRIENLRSVTRQENAKNLKYIKPGPSGVNGVRYRKGNGGWVAEIRSDGKKIHIGSFRCKTAAVIARKQAEKKYGYHELHGWAG